MELRKVEVEVEEEEEEVVKEQVEMEEVKGVGAKEVVKGVSIVKYSQYHPNHLDNYIYYQGADKS